MCLLRHRFIYVFPPYPPPTTQQPLTICFILPVASRELERPRFPLHLLSGLVSFRPHCPHTGSGLCSVLEHVGFRPHRSQGGALGSALLFLHQPLLGRANRFQQRLLAQLWLNCCALYRLQLIGGGYELSLLYPLSPGRYLIQHL